MGVGFYKMDEDNLLKQEELKEKEELKNEMVTNFKNLLGNKNEMELYDIYKKMLRIFAKCGRN
jgi:hypothetical protein